MKKRIFPFLMAVFLVLTPVFVFPRLGGYDFDKEQSFTGLLTLWNIDTFEGGTNSRADFLKKQAIAFEKQNKGLLISVQNYSMDTAEQKLQNGETFDLVSFGAGMGEVLLPLLSSYDLAVNVRQDVLSSGMVDGQILALPYLMGGYMLVAHSENLQRTQNTLDLQSIQSLGFTKTLGKKTFEVESFGVGFAPFTNPLYFLKRDSFGGEQEGNLSGASSHVDFSRTTYMAYSDFLTKSKFTALLGTQRDLVRVENKVANNTIATVEYHFLGGYTDIVQYIGMSKANMQQSKLFMQFLTTDEVQSKANYLKMFSPCDVQVYTSGRFLQMQEALQSSLVVPSVFRRNDDILQERQSFVAG